jgi:hypothetical protein
MVTRATPMQLEVPEYRDLIERALERELAVRRELRPHAQLAIPANATPAAIEAAYARLRSRYDADAFVCYGPATVAAARGILELLRDAHESMRRPMRAHGSEPEPLAALASKPRADETCRALETLRGAIDRRLREAQAHRVAGRLPDAMRVYESVLVLDRQNEEARKTLRELRAEVVPQRPSPFSRILHRVSRAVKGG